MTKKPQLDKATRELAERMLRMPPKPHEEMKVRTRRQISTGRKAKRKLAGEKNERPD
jgi:hypothetical protein